MIILPLRYGNYISEARIHGSAGGYACELLEWEHNYIIMKYFILFLALKITDSE
jgi:hypothetical protein